MRNFFIKLKNISNDSKLLIVSVFLGFLFWIFAVISDSFFKNILFSLLFVITPYIALFISEFIKGKDKFKNISLWIINIILISVINFFLFLIFSRSTYGVQNNVGTAFGFAFFGFLFSLVLVFGWELPEKIKIYPGDFFINAGIIGSGVYFIAYLILSALFDSKLFGGSGFQKFFYLIIQSLGCGIIYAFIGIFLKNIERLDEFLDILGGISINITKDQDSEKEKTQEPKDHKSEE